MTRLKVRDPSAIGQIFGCPKCGSMVLVEAPEGWQPITEEVAEGTGQVDSADQTADSTAGQGSNLAATQTATKVTKGLDGTYVNPTVTSSQHQNS